VKHEARGKTDHGGSWGAWTTMGDGRFTQADLSHELQDGHPSNPLAASRPARRWTRARPPTGRTSRDRLVGSKPSRSPPRTRPGCAIAYSPRSQDRRARRTWTRGPSGPGAKRTCSRAQMVPASARPCGTASRRTNVGAKRVRTDRAARASQRTGQPGRSRRGFAKADATARSAAPVLCYQAALPRLRPAALRSALPTLCATARTRTKGQ
jgi:hypothetical protein